MSLYTAIRTIANFKFRHIYKSFGNKPFKLLDVGAGNNSATRITAVFPQCEYYGLDMSRDYNNNEADFNRMKGFYELDLTKLDYQQVPDNFFDGICMAHVIEHLHNGDEVLPGLIQKIKSGGYFYIEFPGEKSTRLPSMYGTLNFYDDATHVRVYSHKELSKIFIAHGCEVLKSGTRRNWFYILTIPLRAIISMIQNKGKIQGNVLWDLLGFAEYVWVRKN
jgi:SAM-dependent methyltransferase